MSDLSGIIKKNTHFFQIRVFYEDTDFTGIVYHANYLKFAERGRTNFLRLLGINHYELMNNKEPKYFQERQKVRYSEKHMKVYERKLKL